MKRMFIICCLLSLLMTACGLYFPSTPIVIVVTATPQPIQVEPTSTHVFIPTYAPPPADTLSPITVSMIDQLLLHDGYLRYPFNNNGGSGFNYVKENSWERISLYDSGQLQLEVLSGSSVKSRSQHMEIKFKVLDEIFPAGFMSELRSESESYNQSIPSTISSIVSDSNKCPNSNNLNDDWHTLNIECNESSSTIGGFPVTFALWFWQVTCPPQYSYCYFNGFPGAEYVGQSSFTFYDIYITFIPGQGTSQGG